MNVQYQRKEFREVFLKMLNESLKQGLINNEADFDRFIRNRDDISNFYVMIQSIVAEAIIDVFDEIDNVYYSNKIDYSIGSDLDDLGLLLNCNRPMGTRSAVQLEFTLNYASETDILIPKGVLCHSSYTGLSFKTVEDMYIVKGETDYIVTALCTVKGSKNQTKENTVNMIDTDLSQYTSIPVQVNNPKPSYGGSDAFNDADYRTLIKNWILKKQKGNLTAYMDYLDNIDGVESYNIVPNWDGSGTVKLIIDCENSAYTLNNIYDGLIKKAINIDSDIVLVEPDKIPIDIYTVIDVNIDRVNPYSQLEMKNIQNRIETAINTYINGGTRVNGEYYKGLTIGQDFVLFQLNRFVAEEVVEVQNMSFGYPKDTVNIPDDHIGVMGEVKLEIK
jgi:uncharacterized phage protein gp47/JayE